MGFRTTLALLLVAGLLYLLLRWTDEKPAVATAPTVTVLRDHVLDQATRIRWAFADQPPIELRRDGDGALQLAEPIVDRVNAGYLHNIALAYDSAQLQNTPLRDTAEDREKAGLEPPALVFEAWFQDGQHVSIEVGAVGPLGTDRFVRTGGAIWRGSEALIGALRVGLDDLRDPLVFRHNDQLTTEVLVDHRLETGSRELLHVKRDGLDWRLVAPVQGRADAAQIQGFLRALLSLRIDFFLPSVLRPPARPAEIAVTVHGALGTERIELWREQGQLIGQLPARKLAFQSSDSQFTQIFQNGADALRARVLFPATDLVQQVVQVILDPGAGRGERTRLERSSPEAPWRIREPVDAAVPPTPLAELLQALNNLRAVQFEDGADPAAYGLGADSLRVGLRTATGGDPTWVRIGRDERRGELDVTYACRVDDSLVVAVPQAAAAVLRRPWPTYCDRTVLALQVPVERLDLWRHGSTAERSFRSVDGQWSLAGETAVREWLGGFVDDVLRDLRARAVRSARLSQLGDEDWSVALCRANGDRLATLRVWDRGDAPLLVQPTAQPELVYELDPAWSRSLRDLWQ